MASSAFVRSRPQRTREPASNRDSNALRASVLDVALQLGIGTSRAVENLIFNSILEDDENVTTPPLTSASAATSDESWPSIPASGSIPADLVLPVRSPPNIASTLNYEAQVLRTPSEDSHTSSVSRLPQSKKLRKSRKDGYENVGGYLSDNSKKAKDSQDRKTSISTIEQEYQSDGGYLSDGTKRGVGKKKKSTKKSRNPSDDSDIPDGGYLSEASTKKKKTFFRLRSRSPSTTRKETPSATPPPVPALPPTPLSNSENLARSPIPFNWPVGAPIRSALNEPPDLTSPVPRKGWTPLPPSAIVRSTTKSLSVDTTPESLTPSTTSHEFARYSPALPSAQASSFVLRPPKTDNRVPSSPHFHERTPSSAPSALRPYGVRFAPSTRSDSLDFTFPTQQFSPIVTSASEKLPPRPKTSPLTNSRKQKASHVPSSHAPPSVPTVSPMPIQPDLRPLVSHTLLSTPSPLLLAPSTSPPQRGASPALSEFSIVSSSDFIVPSPRPRFFEDLPPPSPPPTCPLPKLPSYPQPAPQTNRGRQLPFPVRGASPVQGASRPIEGTECMRQEALPVHLAEVQAELQMETHAATLGDAVGGDVHGDDQDDDLPWLAERVALVPPSPPRDQQQEDDRAWPDDESVRPDTAQFYLYAPPSPSGGAGGGIKRPSPDVPDDERSTYTLSYAPSPTNMRASAMTASVYSDIHSYYFGEPDRDEGSGDERLLHARSADNDAASRGMRARLMARADALYRPEKIPPVPKIRPF